MNNGNYLVYESAMYSWMEMVVVLFSFFSARHKVSPETYCLYLLLSEISVFLINKTA